MEPGYLFDSYALLALFQKEKGAEMVAGILKKTYKQNLRRMISVINVGELVYLTKKRFGDRKKIEMLSRFYRLRIEILPAANSLVFQAAEIKAEYSLSYADCFALACALNKSAVLVTGDPEFESVSHLIKIDWIR